MIEKREEIAKILLAYYRADYYPNIRDVYATQILSLIFADDQTVELLSEEEIGEAFKHSQYYGGNEYNGPLELYTSPHQVVVKAQASKMIEDGWRKARK